MVASGLAVMPSISPAVSQLCIINTSALSSEPSPGLPARHVTQSSEQITKNGGFLDTQDPDAAANETSRTAATRFSDNISPNSNISSSSTHSSDGNADDTVDVTPGAVVTPISPHRPLVTLDPWDSPVPPACIHPSVTWNSCVRSAGQNNEYTVAQKTVKMFEHISKFQLLW